MKKLIILLLFINCSIGWAQFNLVPNPSFEDNNACPNSNGQISLAPPWQNVFAGIDYYNECGINGYDIPENKYGGGFANSGQAYIGYSFWSKIFTGRKYVGVELTTLLISGKKYNVELYMSMMDSVWYSIKNIGIYFSNTQPLNHLDTLLSKEPQVKYEGADFLTEKIGWTKIEGSFIAQGGEKFITIGNFDNDANTDTLFVTGGVFKPNLPNYWEIAGYFIDDVSVELDTLTGVEELEQVKFDIYPNPANNNLTIEYSGNGALFELYDVYGRVVKFQTINETKISVTTDDLQAGIYHYCLRVDNEIKYTGKQLILK